MTDAISFVQTSTTTGQKVPFIPNILQGPFNVSAAVVLVGSSTGTYGVEFTLDDVNDPTITPVWFNDANLPTGQTANGVTNYAFPVRAIRINIAAVSGSIRFTVIQGM